MANPAIIVVDDEPAVLRAVERELGGRYGTEYRVVAAGSGEEALDVLRRLALRESPVALLVVDQRMPGMTGIQLLAAALELVPDAKRVLLTAYADTDVAIRAINEIASTSTSRSRGTRPRSASSRSSTTFWRTGAAPTARRSRGSGSSATAGRPGPTS